MLYSHFETELRSQLIQINRKLKKKRRKKRPTRREQRSPI